MAEINAIETKRTIQRLSETRSWFFEKNNKRDKPLSKLKDVQKISKLKSETKRHNKGHQENPENCKDIF